MRALDVLGYVAGFVTARALLFMAPIAMANLLPLEHYGRFELAQSWASIGALVLGFGLSATVPLIRLRDEIEGRWDSLLLLVAALAGCCLLVALGTAAGLATLSAMAVLVPLAVGVLMLQGLWAITLKSEGHSTSAVLLEAGFWAVSVAGAGLIVLSGNSLPDGAISATLFTYAAVLIIVTVLQFNRSRMGAITMTDLRRNLGLGLPLMFTSALTVIVISSGRLVLGQTSGVEAVGLYAVLYRCTTLPLVGHQILIIGLFRQIFTWSDELLRARASVIVLGVTAMVLVFWLLEPVFGFVLGRRFTDTFGAYRAEGLTLLLQTILWSAIALNDLLNSRLQIAGRVARLTAPVLALGLGALWLWTLMRSDTLDLDEILHGFILGHFALMAIFFAAQCAASVLLGHRSLRLWLTVAVCTAGAGGLVFLGEYIR